MNTEQEYPHPLITMWRIFLSLPLALCWLAVVFILMLGWGREAVDLYVKFWNDVVCKDDDDDSCGPDACACC